MLIKIIMNCSRVNADPSIIENQLLRIVINKIDSKYHNHCFREVFAFVEGIAESFTGKCLSKPSIIKRADNKVFQAKLQLILDSQFLILY